MLIHGVGLYVGMSDVEIFLLWGVGSWKKTTLRNLHTPLPTPHSLRHDMNHRLALVRLLRDRVRHRQPNGVIAGRQWSHVDRASDSEMARHALERRGLGGNGCAPNRFRAFDLDLRHHMRGAVRTEDGIAELRE